MNLNIERQINQIKYRLTSGHKYRRLDARINVHKKKVLLSGLLAILVIVALTLGLYYGLKDGESGIGDKDFQRRHGGAVVANGIGCAEIGTNILKMEGSAADAAIATLFCEGILCPQSMGLGGGFLLTIYTRSTRKAETLIAREVAPIDATEDMFVDNAEAAVEGGLSIAVPGELKGYWELHQKYGKLKWETLIRPTIDLCRTGHEVSPYLARILKGREQKLLKEPTLREIYINPATNETWVAGSRIRRLQLANSLEVIAKEGADALYSKEGSLLPKLLKDLKDFKSILKEEDFLNYKVRWEDALSTKVHGNNKILSGSVPGSGIILNFMLNILNGYSDLKIDAPLTWHRVVESFKFGYAKRTDLGDPDFVAGIEELLSNLTSTEYADFTRQQIVDTKTFSDYSHYGANFTNVEDHGTAHVSILAPNGDAVSVTSTINYILGAMLRSPSTGIILNDEMDDFSTPGVVNSYGIPSSPANYITPGKMPISSMTPTIVVDENDDVSLVIGGAGGSKITTATVYVILRHIFFGEDLQTAVDAKRLHHQLAPMKIQHELDFDPLVLTDLRQKGHVLEQTPPDSGFAALIALSKDSNHTLTTAWDPRRGGSASIID